MLTSHGCGGISGNTTTRCTKFRKSVKVAERLEIRVDRIVRDAESTESYEQPQTKCLCIMLCRFQNTQTSPTSQILHPQFLAFGIHKIFNLSLLNAMRSFH